MLVFDLETDRVIDRLNDNMNELRITVACFVDDNGYRGFIFRPGEDIQESLDCIREMMDGADTICAYNGRGFDMRVLYNYFDAQSIERWLDKLVDPFEVIRHKTNSWVKLDELCECNGLGGKSGDGLDAISWWQNGEYEKVLEYCEKDTVLLWKLVKLEEIVFPLKQWNAIKKQHDIVGWRKLRWKNWLGKRRTK